MSDEFYNEVDQYVKYVSTKLGLTKEQSVMLALFLNKGDDNNIYISEIGQYASCSMIRIMRYMNDIDVLENREFIRCCRDGGHRKYRVPIDVVDAFRRNEVYVPKKCTGLSCQELFCELDDLFDLRSDGEITYNS